MIRLVLGGNKSGKSSHALSLLKSDKGPHILLATGQATDMSFRQQILDHRTARDPRIAVRETGVELMEALEHSAAEYRAILVDSLDFWLFACTQAGRRHCGDHLLKCLAQVRNNAHITLVSCEAGLGPIPANRSVRLFIRELGAVNQKVAHLADEVCLMIAGLPMHLKRS